jgi:hypothetical protein
MLPVYSNGYGYARTLNTSMIIRPNGRRYAKFYTDNVFLYQKEKILVTAKNTEKFIYDKT